jgi:tripartite-type tricarboxylate transporter receptor subunit TctC
MTKASPFRIFALTGLLLGATTGAFAQDAVADFYKGKSIRFVIGAISGGGNDTYARLVGRHLGKHIPGNPAILPINMPGASGHISAATSTPWRRRTVRLSERQRRA